MDGKQKIGYLRRSQLGLNLSPVTLSPAPAWAFEGEEVLLSRVVHCEVSTDYCGLGLNLSPVTLSPALAWAFEGEEVLLSRVVQCPLTIVDWD